MYRRSYKWRNDGFCSRHMIQSKHEHLFDVCMYIRWSLKLVSVPQNPHAGSAGSNAGPALRELPLRAPQTGWQVVVPRLHSASVSCVRTSLSACLFSSSPSSDERISWMLAVHKPSKVQNEQDPGGSLIWNNLRLSPVSSTRCWMFCTSPSVLCGSGT